MHTATNQYFFFGYYFIDPHAGVEGTRWKRPLTRQRRLMALGLDPDRAHRSAYNGRGPWWNAGASHMNQAIPLAWLRRRGLMSFLDQYQRLKRTS